VRTLADCSINCANQTLFNNSYGAMQRLNESKYWFALPPLLDLPLIPLQDINLKNFISNRVCDISTPVGLTYTGCGILICALVICLVLCLILRGGTGTWKKEEAASSL